MVKQFQDIKIAGIDEKASGPSGEGALIRLVLRLTDNAPGEWSQLFNNTWGSHLYGMKRRASTYGDHLEIICVLDELESDHLPELKKVIADTNATYRRYLVQQAMEQKAEEEKAKRQEQQLSDLKSRLKFDD